MNIIHKLRFLATFYGKIPLCASCVILCITLTTTGKCLSENKPKFIPMISEN